MKFICYGCDKPCILDAGDYAGLEVANLRCVVKNSGYCKWEKCNDGEVANLPKLTAEVFDRPDCPEWAKWAAVDEDGKARFHAEEPFVPTKFTGTSWCSEGNDSFIDGKFDANDWKNSLIERPTRLPDWCEVGEFGYDHNNKVYFKIKRINNESIVLQYPYNEDVESNLYIEFFMAQNPTQARLRPYNAEEMKALVGRVVKKGRNLYSVTAYIEELQSIIIASLSSALLNAELLIVNNMTIDGSPCGVLEHLEEGEWRR
jgi:hypothetical protein